MLSPLGEAVWWLVGSTETEGLKGRLSQPVIGGSSASWLLNWPGSTQLSTLKPTCLPTPQEVGLVMKARGREPGGRGGEEVALLKASSGVIRSVSWALAAGTPQVVVFTLTNSPLGVVLVTVAVSP